MLNFWCGLVTPSSKRNLCRIQCHFWCRQVLLLYVFVHSNTSNFLLLKINIWKKGAVFTIFWKLGQCLPWCILQVLAGSDSWVRSLTWDLFLLPDFKTIFFVDDSARIHCKLFLLFYWIQMLCNNCFVPIVISKELVGHCF